MFVMRNPKQTIIFIRKEQKKLLFEQLFIQSSKSANETMKGKKLGNCLLYLLLEFSRFFWLDRLRASSEIVSHHSNLVQMPFFLSSCVSRSRQCLV
jgi:hypothetical protein